MGSGVERAWPERGEWKRLPEGRSATRGKVSGHSSPVSTEPRASLVVGRKANGRDVPTSAELWRRAAARPQASFMPVLVLAARLCPPGVEATLFATLMSISNAGGVTGGLVGAGLTQVLGVTKDDFGNLALLIVVCNLRSLAAASASSGSPSRRITRRR